ncbi:ATP-dependent metallopeptidase FtsH/Yme1/Tma family protein [Bradymonadaceae bacterium TMQ3]|uniref:ATP-dependent zinc metalloprotease FtsH n=1 Tax=Lujinxingia sediminis TaxID=2480984 RepID=A0ABY0CT17_9DELT|nr:ATP-dependent zinc metalloprotease FtsH [Lujinxingia sediminis]RDV38942.1 ATP-dependent metallopeptidase FtsH/Yme1/Tma family protein [Bradymonadaceae bacterium TMQ3]RVU44177.1 ATP-dependent metallopeptidase FtsH/Yme1/Tma family protein [Lujinxingia sediminis]TXC76285.1 ATP-dependent zinc metalloprotease FtsH [Bradymonadales bacterium TMQ1]
MAESSNKAPSPNKGTDSNSGGLSWRTLLVVLALGLGALLIFYQVQGPGAVVSLPYSELKARVEQGDVARVMLSDRQVVAMPTEEVLNRERQAEDAEDFERWQAQRPLEDPSLLPLLERQGVVVDVAPQSGCADGGFLWIWVLGALMVFIFWSFMIRRMQMLNAQGPGSNSPVMSFGKSRARVYAEEGTGVTFEDVAGVEEAKEELREIISFLREPSRFTRLGGKVPKGVLLVGPPGTGKTLLARAVAGEAEVPFFNLSGSDFVEMFVGVGAARVRDLFQQAQESAPCIIFVDELDAIGKTRGAAGYQSNEEREQTLNALLVEMDGFDTRSGVIILAATNRPEVLDPALLRSGRFDRQVVVDRPDKKGRRRILEVHARRVVMSPDVDLDVVAAQTPGFVGADLANIVNEAALLAARKNKSQVELEDFQASIERVMAGLERKSRRLSEKESRIVAYHEAGHAIVAGAMSDADPVHKISIVSRGIGALGYTLQVPLEDRYLVTRSELHDRICMLLGGRAAEHIVFGDVSSGAANDLQRVTDIARRMVSEYGMGHAIGNLSYGEDSSPFLSQMGVSARGYSDQTAEKIDAEVRQIVSVLYQRTLEVLEKNVDLLHEMADTLREQEVLEGAQLATLMERVQPAEAVSGLDGASAHRVPSQPDEPAR